MIDLVGNALKGIAPTQWQLRPNGFPSISFSFVDESGLAFADDEEIETEVILQIDVWSKKDYSTIVEQVKTKLKEIEFYRDYEADDYEQDTKIYHKILRFNHIKN